MASRHRILWDVPGVGQLRCLKKDPTKLSMWVETYRLKNSRKTTYINLQCHEYYNNPHFEGLIRRLIASVTNHYKCYTSMPCTSVLHKDVPYIEQGLDFLFKALGRPEGRDILALRL